jgi:hypothetical protein
MRAAARATTTRILKHCISGVEAAVLFKDILAAAVSPSAPDISKLATAWKCDVEQAQPRTGTPLSASFQLTVV